jgi:hypothetical protein
MTRITCSNSSAFLELIKKLRADGIKVSGSADCTGFFYVDILE